MASDTQATTRPGQVVQPRRLSRQRRTLNQLHMVFCASPQATLAAMLYVVPAHEQQVRDVRRVQRRAGVVQARTAGDHAVRRLPSRFSRWWWWWWWRSEPPGRTSPNTRSGV